MFEKFLKFTPHIWLEKQIQLLNEKIFQEKHLLENVFQILFVNQELKTLFSALFFGAVPVKSFEQKSGKRPHQNTHQKGCENMTNYRYL